MGKGVRVNLCVPESIDALLVDLARLSGRSKASWVMEAIEFQLPGWHARRDAIGIEDGELAASRLMPHPRNGGRVQRRIDKQLGRRLDALARVQREGPGALRPAAEGKHNSGGKVETAGEPLTRQQRRALEREQAKEADRSARLQNRGGS